MEFSIQRIKPETKVVSAYCYFCYVLGSTQNEVSGSELLRLVFENSILLLLESLWEKY